MFLVCSMRMRQKLEKHVNTQWYFHMSESEGECECECSKWVTPCTDRYECKRECHRITRNCNVVSQIWRKKYIVHVACCICIHMPLTIYDLNLESQLQSKYEREWDKKYIAKGSISLYRYNINMLLNGLSITFSSMAIYIYYN